MSQQSETADRFFQRLSEGPVPLAQLISELREKWGPDHLVGEVHRFAEEVAACLMRQGVEIGDRSAAGFIPWTLEPWDAHSKFSEELMTMTDFLVDRTRYVFRLPARLL